MQQVLRQVGIHFAVGAGGWFSSESASRFALIGSAQAVARRGFLLIVSLHNLMHTPYRLRQTCNDLRRLQCLLTPSNH